MSAVFGLVASIAGIPTVFTVTDGGAAMADSFTAVAAGASGGVPTRR